MCATVLANSHSFSVNPRVCLQMRDMLISLTAILAENRTQENVVKGLLAEFFETIDSIKITKLVKSWIVVLLKCQHIYISQL